jgi:hypothetical protein
MFKKELLFCSALILMGFLDWLTTVTGLLCFGAVEINPLLAGLTKANILAFSSVKLLIVVLVGFLFYKADKIGNMLRGNSHFGKRFLEAGYFVSLVTVAVAVTNNIITVVRVM